MSSAPSGAPAGGPACSTAFLMAVITEVIGDGSGSMPAVFRPRQQQEEGIPLEEMV